ncbi:hypothetical protein Vafri_2608 [Volvox africanus]|uniref:BHLH domain-containing protein n=1 Tax=Volvox africanus TaxID=51714 RepID=A0A8J4ERZ8_9CHLO|nr:hypothetical protein Vafri_2608 [Volvox africanus]
MDASSQLGQIAKQEQAGRGGKADDAINSSFLEFLTDDLVFGSEALDTATLEAVCQIAEAQSQPACQTGVPINAAPQPGPLAMATQGMKRHIDEAAYSESDEEDEGCKGEKSAGKRAKGGEMSAAATKKACREKARREKLNERFLDLARLVDPGNEPKTDKSTILTDAIKYVQQITVENHQLRQLNKFLEVRFRASQRGFWAFLHSIQKTYCNSLGQERVSSLERERGQQLYQQSLMMSAMGQGQMMPTGQALLVGAPAGMMAGPVMTGASNPDPFGAWVTVPLVRSLYSRPITSGAAVSHAHLQMPAAMVTSASNHLLNGAGMPPSSTPPLPAMQNQQQQLGQGSMLTQAPGALLPQAAGALVTQVSLPGGGTALAPVGTTAGVTFNVTGPTGGPGPSKPVVVSTVQGMMPYQSMYWLQPQMTDSTQDSLLRPPAA